MAQRTNEILVGLDIGTTKVCAIVGELHERGVDIIGIGTHRSAGLRNGSVVNIESTVRSIRKAVEEAELMAGCEVKRVHVALSGNHVLGFNSKGIVAIKNREVGDEDVSRVVDAAKAVNIPLDREIIHILPQEYAIDENEGIREPRGICGVRLEAKVHIVTASKTAIENLERCCHAAGLEVAGLVLAQFASSASVLDDDEKELGCVLVDIGGGTTDVSVWHNGYVVHTAVLPVGGNHLTNDIAVGLRTPRSEAERIKVRHGCAMGALVDEEEMIEVPSVGGREAETRSRQILTTIIEPRMEEIFMLVQQQVQASGFEDLMAAGVVLTGGTSAMDGVCELAEEVLGMRVRQGLPALDKLSGLVDVVRSPRYSTGVGLVLYGSQSAPRVVAADPDAAERRGIVRRFVEWWRAVF